jgi:Ca-activated chloride channel family protein
VLRVVRDILYHEPQGIGTDTVKTLDVVNHVLHRRAVVFLISDFETAAAIPALHVRRCAARSRQTNRRHDLIAVHVEDPRERELPNVGIIALEDAETGEIIELDTARTAVRQRFNELSLERARRLRRTICEPKASTPCSCAPTRRTFLRCSDFSRRAAARGYECAHWRPPQRHRCAWLAFLPGSHPGRSRRGHSRHSRTQGGARFLGAACGRCHRHPHCALRLYRLAAAPSPTSAPHADLSERTLQRLDGTRPLMRPETARAFGIAASELIRDYIEKRFDVVATQRTTEEFLQDLLQARMKRSRVTARCSRSFCSNATSSNSRATRWRSRIWNRFSKARAVSCWRPASRRRMIRFLQPDWFWALTVLPLVLLWRGRRGPVAAVEYSDVSLARDVARRTRSRIGGIAWLLPIIAAGLMIVGLARPQRTQSATTVTANGIDIVLALDVSGSMQALDFKVDNTRVNRIAVVKSVCRKFIDERPNDRIGLIAFAGAPYLVSPLTLDHDWLQQNLERVNVGIGDDGTAIGSAIAAAVNHLRATATKSKVVILLTDGVNNTGKIPPLAAAEAARALGVKVYTIGVGVRGKAPIPVRDEEGTFTWSWRCGRR